MVLLRRGILTAGATGAAAVLGYLGLVTAAVPIDLGLGRRIRPLGPLTVEINAPRDVVFDVLSEPYLGRQTRAVAEKLQVLQRGSDMVLAAHHTPIRGHLVATTVETVRFTRPDFVDFFLTRGPVPYVSERFSLEPVPHPDKREGTRMSYTGQLGTDLWGLGSRWADVVAAPWERTVAATFETVQREAERRNRTACHAR